MSFEALDALFEQAVTFHQQGNRDKAKLLYQQILAEDPQHVVALNNLGVIYRDEGDLDFAQHCFQVAIDLGPEYLSPINNLGTIFEKKREWDSAETCYRMTIQIDPKHVNALNNLANVLKAKGNLPEAIQLYITARALEPENTFIYTNLGNAYIVFSELNAARQCFEEALRLEPNNTEALIGIGRIYQSGRAYAEARNSYSKVLEIDPNNKIAIGNLGIAMIEDGEIESAYEQFRKLIDMSEDNLEAKMYYALSLPILYDSEEDVNLYRERYTKELDNIVQYVKRKENEKGFPATFLEAFEKRTNFYLGYQQKNDRDLQRTYAELIEFATKTLYPWKYEPKLPLPPQRKIRLGYISEYFRNHTVGKLIRGFFEYHDTTQFEVFCYYLADEMQELTSIYQFHSDHFKHLKKDLNLLIKETRSDQLDIMIFPEIGMSPVLLPLVAARVAPIQAMFWGHPITSGFKNMDYFISSKQMEPENAQEHYTEKLVTLSSIGVCYPKPVFTNQTKYRSDFGLNDDDTVFLSCQSLYKYLPQYDSIFSEIIKQVPNGKILFLSHHGSKKLTETFKKRLSKTFAKDGLNFNDYCVFLPHLKQSDYFDINRISDIYLDTPAWSGGNTTLEAISCALSIVTLPGPYMRCRHTYAMLKEIGLDECIASSVKNYIDIAVKLANDYEWRLQIRQHIFEHQEVLFNNLNCVTEFESFLKTAVEQHILQ